jgi:hypothetical protein
MSKCEFCECDFLIKNYKDEKKFDKHVKECRHEQEHYQQIRDEEETEQRIDHRALEVLGDYFHEEATAAAIVAAIKIIVNKEQY